MAANWELVMGNANYLLKGPFLGDRVVYLDGGCFTIRLRLLCVVSNPFRPGISRSPHFLFFPQQPCSSLFFCPYRSSMLACLLACPLLALIICRVTQGGCIASLCAVASPVKGSINTSTHFMEFLGASSKRVCMELLESA